MNQNRGFFGEYGGQFVPETLIPALDKLEKEFYKLKENENFKEDLDYYLKTYAGRPTPIYYAKNLSKKHQISIFLKREDLLHTGAHKINNTIGQALLTKYLNKERVIAETGAGQHGVATATVAALFGLKCTIYMGKVDAQRQEPNLKKMKLLGADISIVETGSQTLKDATNAALRDFVKNVENTHYIIGSVVGPHPYPEMVAHFQEVIGQETLVFYKDESLPDAVVACVGGGSNAIGIFRAFLNTNVKLFGIEAGGRNDKNGEHARTMALGRKGILHGCLTYLLQDENSQVLPVHSISAGLDYPGVGPEHAALNDTKQVHYDYVRDEDVIFALKELSKYEGIIPALESAHAVAYVLKNKNRFSQKKVLINLSGRGDKDMEYIGSLL